MNHNNENKHISIEDRSGSSEKITVTNRGKKLIGALAATVALGALGAGTVEALKGEELNVIDRTEVTLGTGETVWEHASDVDSSRTGDIVDDIQDHSPDLADGAHAGDTLSIPVLGPDK